MSTAGLARRCATGLLLCGLSVALPLLAGATSTAGFNVAVRLTPASHSGVCTSETLSEQTQAVFQVSCASGHFVSMLPIPNRPFAGTHASAFRFHLLASSRGTGSSGIGLTPGMNDSFPEVMTMRVFSGRSQLDEQVEILVSF